MKMPCEITGHDKSNDWNVHPRIVNAQRHAKDASDTSVNVSSSPIQTLTVGLGISPNPARSPGTCALALADFTADREFHPALKICIFNANILYLRTLLVNMSGMPLRLNGARQYCIIQARGRKG
jgi:hypothetical protein